ncbi:receptor-like serine/threonine kinase 2 [Striga asiatica]|uniref:Receptor-like serine/threonine kinase 2 n=1 Tax=Striga asiatica TaxID=4170 RepID=A0A5A7Q9H5_STRAF|nr:receptor-like serine/threonine kinase 2 [Striga asiatica]
MLRGTARRRQPENLTPPAIRSANLRAAGRAEVGEFLLSEMETNSAIFRVPTLHGYTPSRYSSVAHQSSVARCSSVGRCSSVQSRSSSSPVVDSHQSSVSRCSSVALLRPRCTSVVAAPPSSLILHRRCSSVRSRSSWSPTHRSSRHIGSACNYSTEMDGSTGPVDKASKETPTIRSTGDSSEVKRGAARRKVRPRSRAWTHFDQIFDEKKVVVGAQCKHCKKQYACHTKRNVVRRSVLLRRSMLLRPVKELVITGCRLAPVVRLSLLLRRAPPSSLHLRRRCSSVLIDPPSSLLLRPVKELVVTDSPVVQAHRLSL